MDFGYFTLSDNHYPNNPRSASDFVLELRDQAILADQRGFHSAWIGEHHFDRAVEKILGDGISLARSRHPPARYETRGAGAAYERPAAGA